MLLVRHFVKTGLNCIMCSHCYIKTSKFSTKTPTLKRRSCQTWAKYSSNVFEYKYKILFSNTSKYKNFNNVFKYIHLKILLQKTFESKGILEITKTPQDTASQEHGRLLIKFGKK